MVREERIAWFESEYLKPATFWKRFQFTPIKAALYQATYTLSKLEQASIDYEYRRFYTPEWHLANRKWRNGLYVWGGFPIRWLRNTFGLPSEMRPDPFPQLRDRYRAYLLGRTFLRYEDYYGKELSKFVLQTTGKRRTPWLHIPPNPMGDSRMRNLRGF